MNEDFLKLIHSELFADKTDYDTFRKDFSENEWLRKETHAKFFKDKATYDQFNRDLGLLNDTQPKSVEEETNPFYKKLDGLGSFGKIIKSGLKGVERIGTAISQGIDQGSNVSEAVNALAGGTLDQAEAEELSKILLNSNGSKSVRKSGKLVPAEGTFTEDFMKDEGVDNIKKSPFKLVGLFLESMAQSGAMMIRGAIDVFTDGESAAIAAGGAGLGAASGSAIPIVGTSGGALAGLMGATSAQLEAAGILYDELNQELVKRNKDINANNILEIFNDETWLNRTRKKASVKGAIVGGIDFAVMAVTAGMGKGAGSQITKGLLSKEAAKAGFKTGIKSEVLDMVGGAGGEGLSEVAIGNEPDPKSMFLEAFGSVGGVLTAGTTYTKAILDTKKAVKESVIKGEPVSELDKKVAEKPLSAPYLVDSVTEEREAVENKDQNLLNESIEKRKLSLAGLAPILTKEQFTEHIEALSTNHDITDEEKAVIYSEFDKYKGYSDSIPLDVVPSIKSMAIGEIDEREIKKTKIAELQDLMNKSDESIKPRFQTQIDELNGQIDVHNENINKIIDNKEIKVKNEGVNDGVVEGINEGVNQDIDPVVLKDKSTELHSLIREIDNTIRESSKTNESLQSTTSKFVTLFDEFPISDGTNSANVRSDIKSFGNILENTPPKAVLEALGKGDIEEGRKVVERAKALHKEFKELQTKDFQTKLKKSEISTEEQLDTKISDIESKKVSDIKTTLTNSKNFQKPEISISEVPAKLAKPELKSKIKEANSKINEEFSAFEKMLKEVNDCI